MALLLINIYLCKRLNSVDSWGLIPCSAERCNTPQSGWDAHSWRSLSRWGCWCLRRGPQRVRCSGPTWPTPSHTPSVWQSAKKKRDQTRCWFIFMQCSVHLPLWFIVWTYWKMEGEDVDEVYKPFLPPCSWERWASWCSSGWPAGSPPREREGTGACCCSWCGSADPS